MKLRGGVSTFTNQHRSIIRLGYVSTFSKYRRRLHKAGSSTFSRWR